MGPARYPFNTFAIPFGVTGVAGAWTAATPAGAWVSTVALAFWICAVATLVVTVAAHVVRGAHSSQRLRDQLGDAGQAPLAAVPFILLMLFGREAAQYQVDVARIIVSVGLVAVTVFAGWLISQWLNGTTALNAVHGGFLVPTVAAGYVAAGSSASVGWPVLGIAAFAVATMFWLVILAVLLVRALSGSPFSHAQLPTLAILAAPPAVGGVALFAIDPGISIAQLALGGSAVLFLVTELFLLRRYRALPFSLGWWTYTFPLGAVCAYGIQWVNDLRPEGRQVIEIALAGFATFFVVAILVGSLRWVGRRTVTGQS